MIERNRKIELTANTVANLQSELTHLETTLRILNTLQLTTTRATNEIRELAGWIDNHISDCRRDLNEERGNLLKAISGDTK